MGGFFFDFEAIRTRPRCSAQVPIKQSLGAWTAAEEGAKFFANVAYEHSCNPRMLT